MVSQTKQISLSLMLSMGAALILCAQQRITPGDAAQLRQQYARELREVQGQLDRSQGESKHVVREAAVAEREARQEQASQRSRKKSVEKRRGDPRSAEEKAKINAELKAFNARIPEINASLAQASSNATLPQIKLTPMTADTLLASAGGKGRSGATAQGQAVQQAVNLRIQEELKKADPATRKQMMAVLKAMEQGKPVPLPHTVPDSKRLTKGVP